MLLGCKQRRQAVEPPGTRKKPVDHTGHKADAKTDADVGHISIQKIIISHITEDAGANDQRRIYKGYIKPDLMISETDKTRCATSVPMRSGTLRQLAHCYNPVKLTKLSARVKSIDSVVIHGSRSDSRRDHPPRYSVSFRSSEYCFSTASIESHC